MTANAESSCGKKTRRRRAKRHDPSLDSKMLDYNCTRLLLMCGRPVDAEELASVACSAPRSPEESLRGSYGCRRCAALLREAEESAKGTKAYGRFRAVFDFFFREVAYWMPSRRQAAEDGLAEAMEKDLVA